MPPPDDFYRIKRLPPYVFEEVNRLKAKLRAEGRDVIDFGMGNPDMPTPPHIIEKLVETAKKPRTNRYSASKGVPGLRRSIARYYERRFGVRLDPNTEVIATLGSKEGFANLAQAMTAPGDVILAPDPAYPIHAYGFIIAGGVIRAVPAPSPEAYLSGMSRAIAHVTPKPTAMVLNYPSNPTAQVVGLDFYRDAVALARKHDIWILSDLAYSEIFFGEPPPSILAVEGAKDFAVEVRAIYRTRRDVLVESFAKAGWEIPEPPASMFAWARIPEAFAGAGSVAFAKRLMEEADVAVAPGLGFGEHGEGFVRIGLVENEQRIRQAARNIKKMISRRNAA
jgi:alanine-synthesizing transaminase